MGMISISIDEICLDYDAIRQRTLFSIPRAFKHRALSDISFTVSQGETLAIMGHNGAGKSTLLNLIAGRIRPVSGSVVTAGRIVHLAGVNPGFDPLLSPRQNIRWLSGVYGSNSSHLETEVEEFSDIGEGFDRPIKTLSTGMRGRVGFGFATSLKPDILLIDEVLGVGDPSFKAKALKRLKGMIKRSGIVMISTHSAGLVKEICNRCIVLENGVITHDGDVDDGISKYYSMKRD